MYNMNRMSGSLNKRPVFSLLPHEDNALITSAYCFASRDIADWSLFSYMVTCLLISFLRILLTVKCDPVIVVLVSWRFSIKEILCFVDLLCSVHFVCKLEFYFQPGLCKGWTMLWSVILVYEVLIQVIVYCGKLNNCSHTSMKKIKFHSGSSLLVKYVPKYLLCSILVCEHILQNEIQLRFQIQEHIIFNCLWEKRKELAIPILRTP